MKFFIAVLALGLILAGGCSEDPTDLGRGLLRPQDTLHLVKREITATGDTTVIVKGYDGLGRIFVGSYSTLEAASVMEFLVSSFTSTQTIDSAVIILRRDYSYYDSTGPFAITAYHVSHTWTSVKFTWDTMAAIITDTVAGSRYWPSVTGDSTISVPIDTGIIRLWSTKGNGTAVLEPTQNALGMNMIGGFGNYIDISGDFRPLLRIYYHDVADTTLERNIRTTRSISVCTGTIPVQAGTMILQSSLASRSVLRFDTLSLPKNVSITEASLWLPVDTLLTALNQYSRDSVVIYMLRYNSYPYDSVAYSTVCSPALDSTGQKYYTGDVKNILQYWNTRGINLGFVIHPFGEYTTMDRFGLLGAASAHARPKLKITYTALP